MTYLYLPRIRIQAANAHATSWVINAAPMMALNMFGHNLGRKLEAFPSGVAVIHHDAQLLGESEGKGFYGRLRPQQRRGASFIDKNDYSSKNPHALSLQPTASCHLTVSLVLSFEDPFDVEEVEEFLSTARIAGGQVISWGEPAVFHEEAELRRSLRSGYWIIERRDLLEGQKNPLETIIQTIGHKAEPAPEGALPNTWIVPTVLGYATITDFQDRSGAREGYPHAFCESLVGLVQYVLVRKYGSQTLPFWQYQWLNDEVFVIQQKKGN